nr:hypothetical protein CFP56_17527 [Quercus suber]
MGSTEEQPSKPISLYDTSSSPSQPLLSKPPPPPPPSFPSSPPHLPFPPLEDPQTPPLSTPADPEQDSDPTQYLQITYNYSPRSFKDLPFLFLFLLFVLCTFVLGIFSIFHRNTSYSNLSSFTYDSNSTSCTESTLSNSTNLSFSFSLLAGFSSTFSNSLIWVFVITFVLTVPICFLLLFCLKRYTKQLVYVSLPFFVVMPVFFNVYWFVACTLSSTCSDDFPLVYRILVLIFVFCIIAVVIWIFVINWHRIELTVEIIKIASDALYRNLGLFVVLPCLTIGLVVYYAPIVVFLVFSRQNGEIVAEESSGEYSCVWKQDGWVPAYYAFAILTMLWSAAVMVETQVFVISGTIAQWYFSKDEPPRRSIRSSLR